MKNKKKAFTLTELLVVVIVIGVLSAAVLPKFSKVIETRKTTEAEELMASIRTEQEKRCALDKPYLTDLSQMNDVIKTASTKNYQINLQDKGIKAASKGNYSYTLQMPSYADGRICCDGDDCGKLNKNYPSCTGFTYEPSPDSCAGTVTPTEPEPKNCTGTAVTERACTSGCGTEYRTATCNTATGNWEYSAWDNSCTAKPASESRECGTGYTGTQTRSAVCKNGVWDWSDWTGTCTKKTGCDGEKPADIISQCGAACYVQKIPYVCKEVTGGTWQWIPDGSQSSGCYLTAGSECVPHQKSDGKVCSSECKWETDPTACPNGTRTDGTCKEKVVSYRWNLNATSANIPATRCSTNVSASHCSESVNFGESNCRSGRTANGNSITTIPGYQYGPGEVACAAASDVGSFYTLVSVSKIAYKGTSWTEELWWACTFKQFACTKVEEWH